MNIAGLKQMSCSPARTGGAGPRAPRRGRRRRPARGTTPDAPDHLELARSRPGAHALGEQREVVGRQRAERVQAVAVLRDAPHERRVHPLPAEPHLGPPGLNGARLEPHVAEREDVPSCRIGTAPTLREHVELLVEDRPAPGTARRARRTRPSTSSPSAAPPAGRGTAGRACRTLSRAAAGGAAVDDRAGATRSVRGRCAMADSSTIGSARRTPGTDCPARRSRELTISPTAADGPSSMCSLSITASIPAASAVTANSTRPPRSRGSTRARSRSTP